MSKRISLEKYQGKFTLVFPVLLIVVGIVLLVVFLLSQKSIQLPQTDVSASPSSKANAARDSLMLPPSMPTQLEIPAIDVRSDLLSLGKNADGTIEVPSADNFDKAAWYKYSPTPGQKGSAIIEGHVDYIGRGPAVFFRLGELKPGDEVNVRRADGKTAIFKVDMVKVYLKDEFPTQLIYGDRDSAALNLITCGGAFNESTGDYESNIIAFTSLVGSK